MVVISLWKKSKVFPLAQESQNQTYRASSANKANSLTGIGGLSGVKAEGNKDCLGVTE